MGLRVRGKGKAAAVALLLTAVCAATAAGEEAWQAQFERTCSRTGDAMNLSPGELDTLLESCAELQKVIETKEESVRKVYLKRLKLCCNLYTYMVEYRKSAEAAK